jgi:hypothetical protein
VSEQQWQRANTFFRADEAPSRDDDGTTTAGVRHVPRSSAHSVLAHSLRKRLVVIAPDLAEAVRYAGGWLFDQVTAGWDAVVLTTDHAYDLEMVLGGPPHGRYLHAIAVQADLYRSDARVRPWVYQVCGDGLTDVWLWDGNRPDAPDGSAGAVRHRLSVAAWAFKAQALAALPSQPALADLGDAAEVFQRNRLVARP